MDRSLLFRIVLYEVICGRMLLGIFPGSGIDYATRSLMP